MIKNHLYSSGIALNDLIVLIGDFNSDTHEDAMSVFCSTYNLKNLVKELTCFKNVENPSCVDLILTNKPPIFSDY